MQSNDAFVPRGAVAFFAALIVVYAVVWAFFEIVMITRG